MTIIKNVAEFNPESINNNFPFDTIQYIDTGSVVDGKLLEIQTLSLRNAPSRAKRIIKKNDILISTVRPNLKHFFFVRDSNANTIASTGFVVIRPTKIAPRYLYYLLTTPIFTEYLIGVAESHTSAYPSFPPEIIENAEIILPTETQQKTIAKILGDLEDGIQILEKQNLILEKIIQTIFKSWFVDFDGQTEFVDSELGQIPKNWRIEHLDNIAVFLNGLPLQRFRPTNNSFLPVIKIREMKNGISVNTEKARTDIEKKYIVNDGNILFSWSGTLELVIWTYGLGALNQHIFKVTSENYEKWFYYFWIKFYLPEFRSIADSKVTTMGHIQKYHLSEALILIPDQETLEEMNKIMIPLFNKFIKTKMFSQNLTKIRDSLLPKLMSGELRV